eukprot:TRINITY_DN8317_c0_g1_i2.p1 TRINITY_DN8317_c0_g1~~TRINITY_DN8317_c0_g1_i2.p1  ORF type:complete len:782 (+),score=71.23 TRINITY_DN8317_c0_g1_i2:734-3079(+)
MLFRSACKTAPVIAAAIIVLAVYSTLSGFRGSAGSSSLNELLRPVHTDQAVSTFEAYSRLDKELESASTSNKTVHRPKNNKRKENVDPSPKRPGVESASTPNQTDHRPKNNKRKENVEPSANRPGVVWLTTFLNSDNAEIQEPQLCSVAKNMWHPQIAQVVLLTEDLTVSKETFSDIPAKCTATGNAGEQVPLSKLTFVRTEAQPTYYDVFSAAADKFSGKLVVIANGHVYPGSAWPSAWSPALFKTKNLALAWTRSPFKTLCRRLGFKIADEKDLCLNYQGSADAFMFVPAHNDTFMNALHEKRCNSCPHNYSFNRWGAENIVMQLLEDTGLKLVNPCNHLQLLHLDCSRIQSAPKERISRPHEQVWVEPNEFPTSLLSASADIVAHQEVSSAATTLAGVKPQFHETEAASKRNPIKANTSTTPTRLAATYLTSFLFKSMSQPHGREMLMALSVNMRNPFIEAVHLLLEGGSCDMMVAAVKDTWMQGGPEGGGKAHWLDKLQCRMVPNQPLYKDFFQYAQRELQQRIVILGNTDVVFDETLGLIQPDLKHGMMLVLSVQPDLVHYPRIFGKVCRPDDKKDSTPIACTFGSYDGWRFGGCSWDVYVWRSPLPAAVELSRLSFPMNAMHAEQRAGALLRQGGVKFSNPCKFVHAFHWHRAPKMHAATAVRGPYLIVQPCWENCAGLHPDYGVMPIEQLCVTGHRAELIQRWKALFSWDAPMLCCPHDTGCGSNVQQTWFNEWTTSGITLPYCSKPADIKCLLMTSTGRVFEVERLGNVPGIG